MTTRTASRGLSAIRDAPHAGDQLIFDFPRRTTRVEVLHVWKNRVRARTMDGQKLVWTSRATWAREVQQFGRAAP